MERAACVAVRINPCPHSLKDKQVVLFHVVDDPAFNVCDAFGDERGFDDFGLRRSQPELPELVGIRP